MGCFSYICNKCEKNIRDGEQCVLRHIRHGEILGETTGTYDTYGRVDEDKVFRSWKKDGLSEVNTHEEICKSEFNFKDSISKETYNSIDHRVYNNKPYTFIEYINEVVPEYKETLERMSKFNENEDILIYSIADLHDILQDFNELPIYKEPRDPDSIKSGIVAFHAKCYHSLKDNPEDEKLRRTPSKNDPEQGCGRARKRFL